MSILDLIFPKKCLECDSEGKYICKNCLLNMESGNINFTQNNYSIFKYTGVIRKAIIKLKYNFATDLANELAVVSAENIKISKKINNPLLVPVPLHNKRENWRGFNQAALLGEKLAQNLNWQYEGNLLNRVEGGISQAQLDREKRLRNIRDKYAVNKSLIVKYKTRNIIVFDDVITTGSTINECKRVLTKSGAKKVYGLSICG